MKLITKLTKRELLSVLFNKIPELGEGAFAECAACGNTPNADFYYICDTCNEALSEEQNNPPLHLTEYRK